jgi:UDP-glucose 4-epimerase
MKNKILVVTGGCGFVGSNLIKILIKKTKFKIISIDNYSSGTIKNQILSNRVKYKKGHTKNINIILSNYKNRIHTIFHFGEFSRIYQSFIKMDKCIQSNTIGSSAVFDFCLRNKIKLVYSATSASIGNKGKNKNLSPYAFTKTKNLEFLVNLKKWFNFNYEVIFFYNVYGPGQIKKGDMSTVIGIFEDHYLRKKPLPIVRPGTQSRRFTHIDDTVNTCYQAWKKNKSRYYSISHKKSYTIDQVANMFNSKTIMLPERKGERYASALTNLSFSNKVYKLFGKIDLRTYINNFIKNSQKT